MTYLCLHAHFYQPTREDPWTGVWPDEPTATPWRNWNERITDECYAPNAAARLLDSQGQRRAVRSNYASLSYDVGPTLLQWLAANRAGVHDAPAWPCRRAGGSAPLPPRPAMSGTARSASRPRRRHVADGTRACRRSRSPAPCRGR